MKKSNVYVCMSAAYAIAVFVFWLLHAEFLSYQEQYQLFLFSADYAAERFSVAGGLADYVGEFLTQFYILPAAGAAIVALVLVGLQLAVWSLVGARNLHTYVLSFLPSVLMAGYLLDENVLLSFPIAVTLSLLSVKLFRKITAGAAALRVLFVEVYLALYWLLGAASVLFAAIVIVGWFVRVRNGVWLMALWLLVVALLPYVVFGVPFLNQYAPAQIFAGINYYRVPNIFPAMQWCVLLAAFLLSIGIDYCARIKSARMSVIIATCIAIVAGIASFSANYDADKARVFRFDYLVRNQRWQDIVDYADHVQPRDNFSLQCTNLALAKLGLLGERMFDFHQNDIGSLVAAYERNNTTCLATAEIFYHLGMINSAFRYNFDLQESILNNRKSGRFMRRMVECLIVNHKYKAASKYINKLKQSMFYRSWALRAEACLGNDELVDAHRIWGEKRRLRFKNEFIYNYNEIEKMFGQLAVQKGSNNLLAWNYFCAALLLKGQLQNFAGYYHFAADKYNQTIIPIHHQEALAFFWTLGHSSFDGFPYQLSPSLTQRLMSFAREYQQNPQNQNAWKPQFGNTYWFYYLTHNMQPDAIGEHQGGSEREG
ncbi:MAG: hypothetical protein J6Y72_06280 [Bacteroidales bacterium]|nr:hypothetical protein [Bacteroidales bacterium]